MTNATQQTLTPGQHVMAHILEEPELAVFRRYDEDGNAVVLTNNCWWGPYGSDGVVTIDPSMVSPLVGCRLKRRYKMDQ